MGNKIELDYFTGWIDGKGEYYQDLHKMYLEADRGFNNRFGDYFGEGQADERAQKEDIIQEKEKIQVDLNTYFEENLKKIERNWNKYQDDEELKKMAYLTKGNILLREGQYRGERFLNPQDYYQQACVVLEQGFDSKEPDFLNLMIQLNLGKYFRNMGKHNQRSDYWRALDEFTEVEKKIEKRKEGGFLYWEIHIWLEAMVNIGRARRYLYHLKEAKIVFLNLIGFLLKVSGEKISINSSLDECLEKADAWKDMRERFGNSKENKKLKGLYEDYLIQALVQLGIAYQKSRDYKIAQDICVAVLKKDAENIDAANNLGVCLRKQECKTTLIKIIEKEKLDGFFEVEAFQKTYIDIFGTLDRKGNRFARLHKLKCDMNMYEDMRGAEEIRNRIDGFLNRNPADQELRLLKGLFLQKLGKLSKSQKIFKSLYEESPHLSKGTMGLKAYYNMAENLLRQGNFHEAKKYFEKIQKECREADEQERENQSSDITLENNEDLFLEDLPTGDLLAEINIGWCLMKLGDYEEAKNCYEEILKNYEDIPDKLLKVNRMRIKNNLGECYLHLVQRTQNAEDRLQLLDKAYAELNDVYSLEPYNSVTNRHLGYYHKLKYLEEMTGKKELQIALEHFERANINNTEDVFVHAGWVSVAVEPLLRGMEFEPGEREALVLSIENKLRYSSGIYSIKACAKLASFVKMLEEECAEGKYDEKKLETMHRSLARIRLQKDEEGYGVFRHFLENEVFRRLKAIKRGEILVALFRLYEQIIKIKDTCRFVPGKYSDSFSIPVHYTKIGTLKKLFPSDSDSPGKLRLWNTVYMNDSFEGECFIEMMEEVEKKRLEKNGKSGKDVKKMMKRYFPYLDRRRAKEDSLAPINENIYVISFSEQDNAIHMWVPYADDARGCAITFADDFFDIRKTEDVLADVSNYSDKDYPLYEIQYLDEKKWNQWKEGKGADKENNGSGEKNKIEQILEIMEEIWEILDDLENRIAEEGDTFSGNKNKEESEGKKIVRKFAADCLNEVRFLIKNSEYSYEKEVRMLHYSYEPYVDAENFDVPRLYVEVERDIQIKEVKLGSKISESQTNEIVSWLSKNENVAHITKSGRHYK